jgi:hypothetical protein
MITPGEVESTRQEYADAQALADEAFAALLEHRKPSDLRSKGDTAALDLWVRRREVADALAIRYFHVTRRFGDVPRRSTRHTWP